MEFIFSTHMTKDRAHRLALLEEYVGFTKLVMEIEQFDYRARAIRRVGMTSTGIIVVRDGEKNVVISAYLGTVEEAIKLSRAAGKKQVPPKLYDKVVKNMTRYEKFYFIPN